MRSWRLGGRIVCRLGGSKRMGFFFWLKMGSTWLNFPTKKGEWWTGMSFIHIDHTGNDSVDQVMAPLYGVADMYVRKATGWGKNGGVKRDRTWCRNRHFGGGSSRTTCITETTTGYSPLIIGCKFEQVEIGGSEFCLERFITEWCDHLKNNVAVYYAV